MDQKFRATRDINEWLTRGDLSLEQLHRLKPGQQATIGRSWKQYQNDVTEWQERWQCSDAEILRAEVPSHHSVPCIDGSMQPKANLDKLNYPSLY